MVDEGLLCLGNLGNVAITTRGPEFNVRHKLFVQMDYCSERATFRLIRLEIVKSISRLQRQVSGKDSPYQCNRGKHIQEN